MALIPRDYCTSVIIKKRHFKSSMSLFIHISFIFLIYSSLSLSFSLYSLVSVTFYSVSMAIKKRCAKVSRVSLSSNFPIFPNFHKFFLVFVASLRRAFYRSIFYCISTTMEQRHSKSSASPLIHVSRYLIFVLLKTFPSIVVSSYLSFYLDDNKHTISRILRAICLFSSCSLLFSCIF